MWEETGNIVTLRRTDCRSFVKTDIMSRPFQTVLCKSEKPCERLPSSPLEAKNRYKTIAAESGRG